MLYDAVLVAERQDCYLTVSYHDDLQMKTPLSCSGNMHLITSTTKSDFPAPAIVDYFAFSHVPLAPTTSRCTSISQGAQQNDDSSEDTLIALANNSTPPWQSGATVYKLPQVVSKTAIPSAPVTAFKQDTKSDISRTAALSRLPR